MKRFIIIASVCLLAFTPLSKSYAQAGFSEINNSLFDSPHLKNITVPGTLHYKYHIDHFSDGSRDDTVDVVVSNLRLTGRKDTHFIFFTGKHNLPYPDRENQQGNGVFVYFLQNDVRELERHTGGDYRYFQRKIRWAFAKGAEKKEIEVDYKGKKIKATQYIIQPFINDPKNSRYPLYANKYYIFTLSDQIPGAIYQLRTIVPDGKTWKEGDVPLSEQTLTFVGFEPKKQTGSD